MPASVIPTLRYADAPEALRVLTAAFGFTEHLVVRGDAGRIEHAQLVHGTGMVMVSSTPAEGDRGLDMDLGTASVYVVLPPDADVDAHAATAVSFGVRLVREPTDEEYGGRGYTCRDGEGHYWSFGTFDPWAEG
jgi:uncharacterized glyoxalase superfamily protein PhnB